MKKVVDIIVVGFAIFSMFFGAGNLIFPPYIGMASGSGWLISYLGFIISDVGMILLSIIAIAKAGSYQAVLGRAGKKFGLALEVIIMLCLGPILIIPRTGATTFEISIAPLTSSIGPVMFSIIFFALTFILTVKPNKVVDIIGKFLTPILLLTLAALIVKGVLSPLGELSSTSDLQSLFSTGLAQGYQTMDALGSGGIATLIIATFLAKGYKDKKEVTRLTIKSSLVAAVGLILIYSGLAYLGATVSNIYDTSISQTALLIAITKGLLGSSGGILLSIVAPILTILYPVALVLVLMVSFKNIFTKNSTYKGAAYATLLVSTLTVIDSLGININFIHALPFDRLGFNWIIPAIIGGILGTFIFKDKSIDLTMDAS